MHDERLTRLGLLLVILAVFLLVPLRIMAFGYTPPDDALRHAAFAVANRPWGDIILLDPRFPSWMDPHPGWHALLRVVHEITAWAPGGLVTFSMLLACWTFMIGGAIASGNAPAWFLACALVTVLEPALVGKLLLGRPLFVSMAAVTTLLFVWTRREPLRLSVEVGVVTLVLVVSLLAHSSSWYLWLIALPPLVVCRRWRAVAGLAVGLGVALTVTGLVNGWYNAVILPIEILQLAVLQGATLGTNLALELQPSGAPLSALFGMGLTLLARKAGGRDLPDEMRRLDLAFVVMAWILGLYVGRFWIEWGIPAMTVWYTRQIAEGLGISFASVRFRSASTLLFGAAAAILYLSQTADVGGRYTGWVRSPLVIAPVEEIAADMPGPGGILYSSDMGVFYLLFHRLPDAKFRFATAFEPGLMPAEDLTVLRGIQTTGVITDYKPWFEKMTPADRVMLRNATMPTWPGLVFKPFYGGWIGRKAPSSGP